MKQTKEASKLNYHSTTGAFLTKFKKALLKFCGWPFQMTTIHSAQSAVATQLMLRKTSADNKTAGAQPKTVQILL